MPRLRPPHKDTIVCACLCCACALLSLGLFMAQDGGAFTLREDFDFQQIPFTMALHKQIARGGLAGWCWTLDLGTSAIQGFGFYELGSPFFWASMLFDANAFPYVVGWMYVCKYVVAGVTAYLFLRRFAGHTHAATIGALLYAFSGFQTANLLFYHFHDVVALFPLLLIGLERLMHDRRDIVCFVLAVCANALVNYFFFVQDVLFLLLYFGFRFGPNLWQENPRALARAVLRCLVLGTLGAAMAAVLLVPSLAYMLGNPRTGSSTLSLENLLWDPREALFQLQGFLLPADAMFDHNAVIDQQWTSTSCWLPLVGPSLVLAYLKRRLRTHDWLARLIVALLVVCASPLLTSAFILFTGIYQRWWYALVLMGALASTLVLDRPHEFDVRFGTTVYACLLVAFVATVLVCAVLVDASFLLHPDRFALYVGMAAAGCAATRLLTTGNGLGSSHDNGRLNQPRTYEDHKPEGSTPHSPRFVYRGTALLCAVLTLCVLTTATTTFYYRQNPYAGEMLEHIEPAAWRDTLDQITLGTQLPTMDAQYRYATEDNRLTLTGDAAGTSSFCSTIANATGRFEEFFDWGSWNVWNLAKESVPGLSELLGGRYLVVSEPGDAAVLAQYATGNDVAYVVEKDACPLGFLCTTYALADDVYELPVEQRALALMQAPVVSPDDEDAVMAYAQRRDADDLDLTRPLEALVAQTQERAVDDFWRDDHGFGFVTSSPQPALVYLSVPHDEGWVAHVDNSEVTTVDSAGMTLLPLPAGRHVVRFSYQTPGLSQGLVLTGMSWLAFALVVLRSARQQNR